MNAALSRFHRQLILPGFSEAAQTRLGQSHALVVGCGALGCASVDLLVRAGVGRVTIVDRDTVEETNLQRQCLYTDEDARRGVPKAEAAARRVRAINPACEVRGWVDDFRAENAREYARGATIMIDGLDNFETRYLLNDLAIDTGTPYIYCAAVGYEGMTFPIVQGEGPCLRCVFPTPPAAGSAPTCDRAGIFGPAIAVAAGYAMAVAIRRMAGIPTRGDSDLVSFDLMAPRMTRVRLGDSARCPGCSACVDRQFEFLDGSRSTRTTALCGRNAVQVLPACMGRIDLAGLRERLVAHGEFSVESGRLRGELLREATPEGGRVELTVFEDGRAIIRGSVESALALRIYAKYVGL
ncbi:MAG: thiazole biosynthesis adenylyltransferase ThiF [Phycisphaerales bacterium]|nr:thiazole biosynthesis adenylyltransferase ThiF [Phycisphaerales bacterium]